MLISANKQIQGEQVILDNIAFAMDTMTREIRTGTNYYCAKDQNSIAETSLPDRMFDGAGNDDHESIGMNTEDCEAGRNGFNYTGISFIEGGNSITGTASNRIAYYFKIDSLNPENQTIYRRVGNGPEQKLISTSDVLVQSASFFVTGTDTVASANETTQPTVTIQIEAVDANAVNPKTHFLSTTVTQRTLDI